MVCLVFEPWITGWLAHTIPLNYDDPLKLENDFTTWVFAPIHVIISWLSATQAKVVAYSMYSVAYSMYGVA